MGFLPSKMHFLLADLTLPRWGLMNSAILNPKQLFAALAVELVRITLPVRVLGPLAFPEFASLRSVGDRVLSPGVGVYYLPAGFAPVRPDV